jgi:hypothetical protein
VTSAPAAAAPPEPDTTLVVRSAPAAPNLPAERAPQGIRIEEMVVCAKQREVLYEWQCGQAELRLRLVEGVQERSVQMCGHLPLGDFDRLEAQATEGRLVVRYEGDQAILFRSNTASFPGEPGGSVFHQSMAGWLARHAGTRGLLGCGIIRPTQPAISHSSSREFGREPLGFAWRCVTDIFALLEAQPFAAWQLRWIYAKAQLYVARRPDGKALAMFLSKDPAVLDGPSVERVFTEFKALVAM